MFNAMCEELFRVPFDILEELFKDEPEIVSACRKAINEAIANRQNPPQYPACSTLQDHCSWDVEPSPLDLDDGDYDGDGGADVDLLARVGLLGSNNNESGFTQPDDDLPF